jgi:hypothetical protein
MRHVIDLDYLDTIYGENDRRAVRLIEVKRGDKTQFEVMFVREGVRQSLPEGAQLSFGCKAQGKYDGPALVFEDAFVKVGSGINAFYQATPSFNTVALNEAMEVDADPDNDLPFIDLMGEFSWNDGGDPTSTRTFTVRVHNDVLRGDEDTPDQLPDPTEWITKAEARERCGFLANPTVTAVADNNSVPVTATVVRKADSRGWYVHAATAQVATSKCVISIAHALQNWTGDPGGPAEHAAGAILARLTVSACDASESSFRIQTFYIVGSGFGFGSLQVVPAGADLTVGATPPPSIMATISLGAVTLTAACSATSSTRISLGIERF